MAHHFARRSSRRNTEICRLGKSILRGRPGEHRQGRHGKQDSRPVVQSDAPKTDFTQLRDTFWILSNCAVLHLSRSLSVSTRSYNSQIKPKSHKIQNLPVTMELFWHQARSPGLFLSDNVLSLGKQIMSFKRLRRNERVLSRVLKDTDVSAAADQGD